MHYLRDVKSCGVGVSGILFFVNGRRYKVWWLGKGDRVGGVGVMVMKELYENFGGSKKGE